MTTVSEPKSEIGNPEIGNLEILKSGNPGNRKSEIGNPEIRKSEEIGNPGNPEIRKSEIENSEMARNSVNSRGETTHYAHSGVPLRL